jgi:hypothetical protein
MRSFQRGTVAATLLAITASTIAVATPAIADVDPIYDATLTVQDARVRCLDWPVQEDGDWVLGEQAGPTSGDFVFKTTVASIDDNYDIGDYRVILTYGNPATDGVGYSVGGSGAGPHNDGVENEDGSVTSSWTLGVGDGTESAPVTSVGIELIGYTAADGWVLVHTGSIPVVNECIPPTQQVGGPEWLSLTEGGTPVAGRDAYLDAGQRLSVVATRWGTLAGRWICDCTLNLDVTLKIDGEVAYEGGWPSLWYLHMPSDSAGKTAVVTVTATPDGNGPFDSYWTPVTVTSDPVVIGAAPALTGNLHVFSADPGWNVGWGSQVLCSPPLTPMVGYQLWASPWHGKYAKNGPEVDCMPMLDLSSDIESTAQSDVTWYDGDGHVIGAGNPLTVTADMCGDTITAKQSWGHPAFSTAEITGTADYPVFCIQHMTPVAPTVTGTPKVGSPLSVDLAGWLPASTSFAYQWYWELDSSGTNAPIPGATGATFTPTPAQAGHRIWVGIEASASGYYGESLLSDPVTIPVSAPSAPRSLKATPANKAVKLTWTAPSGDGGKAITGYRVQRSTNGTAWTTVKTTTARSYTATGLTNGKKYWFRVVALNSVGSSAASVVTAIPCTKASAPRSLKATAKTKSVALSWAAPSSNGGGVISGYRVYRSTNGKTFTLVKTVTTRATTVTGLTKGKKYWFKVVAVNKAGSSPASNTVTARPK